MKTCKICNEAKPMTEFYEVVGPKDGRYPHCKSCASKRASAWQRANKEKAAAYARQRYNEKLKHDPVHKAKSRLSGRKYKDRLGVDGRKNASLREKYGITLQDYQRMVAEQHGLCAICNKEKKLLVDHCHETDRVRGLLCHGCNRSIGLLGDNVAGLRRALAYLGNETGAFEPLTFVA